MKSRWTARVAYSAWTSASAFAVNAACERERQYTVDEVSKFKGGREEWTICVKRGILVLFQEGGGEDYIMRATPPPPANTTY